MTKNTDSAQNPRLTVRILGADGEQVGLTYPKRAAGLVKKGRARYVNDCDIRLTVSEVTDITEETKMDNISNINQTEAVNRLFFNAREWSFNKDCKDNVGNRSFMQGPDGEIAEAFTIGDWGYNWTEIVSKTLILPKNTLNTFTFWLNGGENDNSNEVCRLEIVFNNDYEGRYSYNLNRSFIKPIKKVNGWELYEIPFRTADNEYTQLRFVAQRAYMTVLAAQGAEHYANLPDTVDEFEEIRPQRHNIVFGDGWPTNTWYSTQRLKREKEQRSTGVQQGNIPDNFGGANSEPRKMPDFSSLIKLFHGEGYNADEDMFEDEEDSSDNGEDIDIQAIADEISDSVLSELEDKINELAETLEALGKLHGSD